VLAFSATLAASTIALWISLDCLRRSSFFLDQISESNGEDREIGPLPPDLRVALFGSIGVRRRKRFLRQRVRCKGKPDATAKVARRVILNQQPDKGWPHILLRTVQIDRDRYENLAEGERIVQDWYQCHDATLGFIWARERITTNPLDLGGICQPDRCLEDVMKELGNKCERQQDGSCSQCRSGPYPDSILADPEFQARLERSEAQ
jgi:hypothetical protein